MRIVPGLSLVAVVVMPQIVAAHPMVLARAEPPADPTSEEPPPFEATSSKAPDSNSTPTVAEPPASDPTEAEPEAEPEPASDATLEGERGRARSKTFNRHGVGVRGGCRCGGGLQTGLLLERASSLVVLVRGDLRGAMLLPESIERSLQRVVIGHRRRFYLDGAGPVERSVWNWRPKK